MRKFESGWKVVVKRLIILLKRELKENLISIVLFGSYARGNERKYSDIDLLIITREIHKKQKENILIKLDRIIYPKDIIFFTESELNNATFNLSPLVLSIFTNPYIILYGKDIIQKKKEELAKARQRISWALVGLVIVFLAYFIAKYAGEIFPAKGGSPFSP